MCALACCAGAWRGEAPAELARALLALVGYSGADDRPAGTLPHVDRRLIEIARALGAAPAVLLLDEPAAGLDETDTAKLGDLLRRLARAGLAIVLVEHDMALVMSISDEIVVLDAGRRIAAGAPAVVRADPGRQGGLSRRHQRGAARSPRARRVRCCSMCASLSAGYGPFAVLERIGLQVAAARPSRCLVRTAPASRR